MLKRLRNKAKQSSQGGSSNQKESKEAASNGKLTPASGQAVPNSPIQGPIQDNFRGDRDEDFADSPTRGSLEGRPAAQSRSSLPDFMTNPNAVVDDDASWRHNKPPNYATAFRKYLKERTNVWPPGSLEDLVTNLIKNWKKESSHKANVEEWRTINPDNYRFSCNGGRTYTAEEMMEVGTSNALIQEAAFYSANHTSFDDSHKIFQNAMPEGFCWEVTEVYSGPPVMAFKWRHWGHMTGKLVCPIGPDTKLEAEATNNEVEVWGICVAHLDPDFRMSKLEVFYDPHELMASLVDANNLSYKMPDDRPEQAPNSAHEHGFGDSVAGEDGFMTTRGSMNDELSDAVKALGGDPSLLLKTVAYESQEQQTDGMRLEGGNEERGFSRQNGLHTGPHNGHTTPNTQLPHLSGLHLGLEDIDMKYSPPTALVSLSNGLAELQQKDKELPSDTALLSALVGNPRKSPPGSRCPFPHG